MPMSDEEKTAAEVIAYLEEALDAIYRKQFDRAQWRCVEAAGLLSRETKMLCRTGRGFELLDHGPKGIATRWTPKSIS